MPPAPSDCEDLAAAYAADNEVNLANAHYERPAILALARGRLGLPGPGRGRRRGAGRRAARSRRPGRRVDNSAGMLAVAHQRLGPGVPLHQADLAGPLPFPDGGFDLMVASLVLHYLPYPLRGTARGPRRAGSFLSPQAAAPHLAR